MDGHFTERALADPLPSADRTALPGSPTVVQQPSRACDESLFQRPARQTNERVMNTACSDFEQLQQEHRALMSSYGEVQTRCSRLVTAQAIEVDRLQAQAMRLRAAVILRDTRLALSRERHAALHAAIPGLPRRVALARRIESLMARIQELMRERLQWQQRGAPSHTGAPLLGDKPHARP